MQEKAECTVGKGQHWLQYRLFNSATYEQKKDKNSERGQIRQNRTVQGKFALFSSANEKMLGFHYINSMDVLVSLLFCWMMHIFTCFYRHAVIKTNSCFSTKTQKTRSDNASLHKLYFGSATRRFPANAPRVHHPPVNTIIPTSDLLICSSKFCPCLGSGSHRGGEHCCKDEITCMSRSARPRIAEMTPFFAELYVPAIRIRNLHSNTRLHVASTQIWRKTPNK